MTESKGAPCNVQIVEQMWAAWHTDDMSDWLGFFDADVVWQTREDEPDAGVYRGHSEIERLMEFWADNFTISGGKIVEIREYATKEDALEALGQAASK